MTPDVYDSRVCTLGEGPLWHPERNQLFWFDILNQRLLSTENGEHRQWDFGEEVSAAGWIDRDTLLVASSTALWRFDLPTGTREQICPLEGNQSTTRSNDGRADPWGGFWIGTMGYDAQPKAGAIYRLYQGQLRKLFADITISNAICFAPDRSCAYFTDTSTAQIMKVALDRQGWPAANAACFIDLEAEKLNPDGAVTEEDGTLWVAQWGAGRVAAYDKNGVFQRAITLPAVQTTCPAFGGADFSTLFVTSAAKGLPDDVISTAPEQGMTFAVENVAKGLPEPRVLL